MWKTLSWDAYTTIREVWELSAKNHFIKKISSEGLEQNERSFMICSWSSNTGTTTGDPKMPEIWLLPSRIWQAKVNNSQAKREKSSVLINTLQT